MLSHEIEAAVKKTISKYINLEGSFVFLFGSRALGESRPTSDYDIGLYSGTRIPLAVIAKIKDELEDYPIPVDIDIVDFSTASDEFKKIALTQMTIWNTPKKNLKLI